MNTWHIDDLVIHKLVDDQAGYNTIDRFLPNLGSDRLEANLDWFSRDGYDPQTRTVLLSYHCYIVETPRHRVFVNTCIGNDKTLPVRDSWHHRHDDRWMRDFTSTGLGFDDIDYVLCTHLHADHVGWNTRLDHGVWVPTFPNARYVMVDDELAFSRTYSETHGSGHPLTPVYDASYTESVRPLLDAGLVDVVPSDAVVAEYFRLQPTPGHTPGHVAIAVGRNHDSVVFTGDLIHSPIQARYPDIVMPTDDDPQRAAQTRSAFLEQYVDTDTLVFTMHFPAPSAGRVHRWHDGYRLEYTPPATYETSRGQSYANHRA